MRHAEAAAAHRTLLTRQEAADALGVGERTLREHIKAGTLRFIAVGRGLKRPRIMIDPDDLADFIEGQRRSRVCPSIVRRTRRTTTSISGSEVIGFTERLAREAAAKRR